MKPLSQDLDLLPPAPQPFEEDSLASFIMEHADHLDAGEPEDPSNGPRDGVLPQDLEVFDTAPTTEAAASPQVSSVRDHLLQKAEQKYHASKAFQEKHRQK